MNGSYSYAKFDDDAYDGSHVPSTSSYLGSLKFVKTISDQWSVDMLVVSSRLNTRSMIGPMPTDEMRTLSPI